MLRIGDCKRINDCKNILISYLIKAKSFCYSTDRNKLVNLINDFYYSLVFDLDQKHNSDDTLIVHVVGKHVVPMIKLNRQLLNYGEVNVNENS